MDKTPQQIAACLHARDSDNHLAVRARAGSGKTKLLVDITHEFSPRYRVLAVAFNKSIRDELGARVPRHVDVKTFNGLGFGAIQNSWGKLTIDAQRQRTYAQAVVPESKYYIKRAVAGNVCQLVSLAMTQLATTYDEVSDVLSAYGVLVDPDVTADKVVGWAVEVLARSRVRTTAISFDDQVFLTAIDNMCTGSYHAVILDEAQDTNPACLRLVLNAVRHDGKIIVVGDDRQAIYSWRGAGFHAFDDLIERLKADVLPLTWTFRCPTRVVALARALVPDLEAAPGAKQGQIIWNSEKEFYDTVQPGDAIIARTNSALTKACMQLLKLGIRAKIAGRDFGESLMGIVERPHVNSVSDFLTWLTPWVTNEAERLTAAGKEDKAEELSDSAEALRELSEGCMTCVALQNKLASLFVERPDEGVVRLSTVHRAKGLQWGRVWLLESSFRLKTIEDENLYYVAVTRVLGPDAAGELRLVQNPNKDGKIPTSIAKTLLGERTLARWDAEDNKVVL